MIVFDLHCESGHRFEGWFRSSSDFLGQSEAGYVACPECGTSRVAKAPMAPAVPVKGNSARSDAKKAEAVKDAFEAASQAAAETKKSDASDTGDTAKLSSDLIKTPDTPAVPAKGGQLSNTPMTAEMKSAIAKLAKAQEKALKDSTWVGSKFAEQSREMHYGERDEAPIHGQASLEEAKSLAEEGVPIAPLPFPVAPPEKLN